MSRVYQCTDCGAKSTNAVYARLHLTRCGLVNAREQKNRDRFLPIGHLCQECLSVRVRTMENKN